jgi:lipoprotein NlpI
MMAMRFVVAGLAAFALLMPPPALAQPQQQTDACANRALTPDVRIDACTALIQSGREPGKSLAPYYADRCWAYNLKGDRDRAMQDCNEAIRIDPANVNAFISRGAVYGGKGDADRAIADFDAATRLDPKLAAAFDNRGIAYKAKGDLDRAIADYDEGIRLAPKRAENYLGRGIANLYGGSLGKALADLDQASKLDPKDAYAALWLDIAGKRSNLASRLPRDVAQIDMTRWPAPVIRMFLGQLEAQAVLAAADDANAYTRSGQLCEANFYTAELALRQGAKDQATRLFGLAVANCPKDFIELHAANAELKTLGATP